MTDRGQAHSLEAITAGMLLLASVLFALQVTAVTPLTGSTSSQHIENQQGKLAEGLLAVEADNGTIVPSILFWNESGRFHGAAADGYHGGGPPTAFGAMLNRTFRERNIAFDVSVYFVRENGEREREPMVDMGTPSDHASTATRSFTLYDDDVLYQPNETAKRAEPTNTTLENASMPNSGYLDHNIDQDGPVYSVVEVEVVVWRM